MTAKKLILNPATLRPAMRVDRPKGARVSAACEVSVGTQEPETQAYWRGFADGAREAQAVAERHELTQLSEMATYYTKTRGF